MLREGLAAGQVTAAVLASQPSTGNIGSCKRRWPGGLRQPATPDLGRPPPGSVRAGGPKPGALAPRGHSGFNVSADQHPRLCPSGSKHRQRAAPQLHRVIVGKPQTSTPTLSSVIKREIHPLDIIWAHLRPETRGLRLQIIHHVRPRDAFPCTPDNSRRRR
ncbi:MAG: hypothetical protein WKG07_00005 [Hymenobacter sp.]